MKTREPAHRIAEAEIAAFERIALPFRTLCSDSMIGHLDGPDNVRR